MKELMELQSKLNVPKKQFNKFGKYNYRNCEDIMEAVKPLLKEQGLVLTITDSIECLGIEKMHEELPDPEQGTVGERSAEQLRVYVKATVTLTGSDERKIAEVSAYAREPGKKKGMDPSQITGAASSYARKVALAGMFLLDDNKDPDVTNTHGNTKKAVGATDEEVPF